MEIAVGRFCIFLSWNKPFCRGRCFLKLKGDVVETIYSGEGRWIIIILNTDDTKFIICNVYGHNNSSLNVCMFKKLSQILLDLKRKYTDAYLLIGGDFIEAPNDSIDRIPPKNKFLICFVIIYKLLMSGVFYIHTIKNIHGQIMI